MRNINNFHRELLTPYEIVLGTPLFEGAMERANGNLF
jgi:hypothetical protein